MILMSNSLENFTDWQTWQLLELNQSETNATLISSGEEQISSEKLIEEKQNFSSLEAQNIAENSQYVEELTTEAHQLGFIEGKKVGYQAGFEQGFQDGKKQGQEQALIQEQTIIETWKNLLSEFSHSLENVDHAITTKLLQIALMATKQVLEQPTLSERDHTALLNNLNQLLQQKPLFSGKLVLYIHTEQIEFVEQHLGSLLQLKGWHLAADPQLHLGGCRVIAEDGEIDMSIATRWQELCKLYAPEAFS